LTFAGKMTLAKSKSDGDLSITAALFRQPNL